MWPGRSHLRFSRSRPNAHAMTRFSSRRLKKLNPSIPKMLFGTSGISRIAIRSTRQHRPRNQSFHVYAATPNTVAQRIVSRIMRRASAWRGVRTDRAE